MIDPRTYWHERLGKFLAPEAQDYLQALMAPQPHVLKPGVVTRMGGADPARFLVDDQEVRIWAPVAPEIPMPRDISFQRTNERKKSDWILDVILDPPEGSFLAATVGMSGADAKNWRMSTGRGLIAIGGNAGFLEGREQILVDRSRFLEAADWFRSTKAPVSDLLRSEDVRKRFRQGLLTAATARSHLAAIKTPAEQLASYPGDRDTLLIRLAFYAAERPLEGK